MFTIMTAFHPFLVPSIPHKQAGSNIKGASVQAGAGAAQVRKPKNRPVLCIDFEQHRLVGGRSGRAGHVPAARRSKLLLTRRTNQVGCAAVLENSSAVFFHSHDRFFKHTLLSLSIVLPNSLSLEYHYDTLAEHNASSAQLPITYLQCPAAVTVHHLYKFILTKNGLQVGSDNVRVEIIYEEEILPHDFTLMDVAYCFDYKRVSDRLECCSLLQCLYYVFPETASLSRATPLVDSVQKENKFHTLSDVLMMVGKQFVSCLFWKTVIEFHLREQTVTEEVHHEFPIISAERRGRRDQNS